MSKFENVSVNKKANVYFDGKCVSYSLELPDGTSVSVGVIQPSSLTFGTNAPEIMEVVAGEANVTLAGTTEAVTYRAGESFKVPGDSSFDIEVVDTLHYVCYYG
ncbi:pyrimidine/purine nucleoside phosphorylase [Nocardia sp. PE-7]|uniref:pyrimidine/purine nucleoside phosphorylase n=1 Tax=Nocardia sp. PE-7 TaxID=3058426 RepID=UPI002659BA80|nr:pyrimidine/purine nucleoside phosphorylase [Nocardia sp. PE-7]WKG11197.1 pyrimidine/purine nucleoside phosphorylase [Nocardia sp. PE-7]